MNMLKIYRSSVFGLILGAISGVAAAQTAKTPPVSTVAKVDLKRYVGTWYEIGRYPNGFQKQCVGNVTANYAVKPSGKLEVKNECLLKSGKTETAIGEAKIADKTTNAKLKVRFAPGALSFLPFVWGDYWVIDLGKDYEYAVVGDNSRKYLWILSRKPQMDEALYNELAARAKQ